MVDSTHLTEKMNSTPLHPKALTKLPDMAVYGPGVAGSVKRKTLVTVPPIQGSSFTPSGQRIIQIFLPKNGFLNGVNSYLTFQHKCPTTSDFEHAALSTSASNWVQRLRIKVGGRIVEDIDDYNVLHDIIRTTVVTQPFRDSLAGQSEGYEPTYVSKATDPVIAANASALPDTLPQYTTDNGATWVDASETTLNSATRNTIQTIRGGVRVNVNRSGNSGRVDSSMDSRYPGDALHTLQKWARDGRLYQIKILSGFLESRRYLPLRFMPPVEIEITLADFSRSHVWQPSRPINYTDGTIQDLVERRFNLSESKVTDLYLKGYGKDGSEEGSAARTETSIENKTYTIDQVNYMAEMLEFDETFYQAFEMSLAQGVTIPYTTFTNHTFAHTGTSADIQVAERVRSAKSLFAVQRRNKDLAYAAYPKFLFSQNGLTEFQVKIGTQYFPMQPVKVDQSGYNDPYSGTRLQELIKCISTMGDTSHAMTANVANYTGMWVVGMDLDREFNRLSGLDTTKGLPLYLTLRHSSASDTTGGKACALNVFVHYDMFVDLFPGEVVEVLN